MPPVPFSPPPGLNSDDTTFAASGQWADGNNVRFVNGKPQPLGSMGTVTTQAGTCYDMFAFTRAAANTVAYGYAGALYVGVGLAAPALRASVGQNDGWSLGAWGDTLLAAPLSVANNGGPLYEQSGSSNATEVTQSPNRIDAGILVTPERQVLAFATNEESSGSHNPLCIRGCDIEDYTDWTTSSSNNAFEHILAGSGEIVLARQIGPYVAVLTTTALYQGQFIGDPSQTYRFDKVSEGCGPMSRRAAAVMDSALYWMGQDHQLRVWAPGAPIQRVPSLIGKEFKVNCSVDEQTRSFMVSHGAFSEIWFFYVDGRDAASSPTRYVAYSLSESIAAQRSIWFRGSLERTAVLDSEIVREASTSNNTGLLGINAAGEIKLHEIQGSSAIDSVYIQSADQYIDNGQRRMMIRSMIPDFELQTSNVLATLFVRDRPQSTAVTKGPYTLATSTTKKDFRASGKIVAVKISTTAAVNWRLGKIVFDVVPMGER